MINILVLSAGTRNKIIQYFKRALQNGENGKLGNVIATDASKLAPAIYEADHFYQVPRMAEAGYIDVILDICKKEQITAVLSLIDPELSLLAKNKKRFADLGVTIIGSDYDLCEMSLDKMQMYEWLVAHNYRTAKSYIDKEAFYQDVAQGLIDYPVFVKPVRGSASISITKAENKETVDLLFAQHDNLMVQEYLNGQEIGADVYVDMISGETVSIFTKNKIKMRAGETDKSVSFKDEELFQLIEKLVSEAGYRGQLDIDVFKIKGDYYISEINPRFGGGYPHAYEAGCDHMRLIIQNLQKKANKKNIGSYADDIYMMKYNEVMIRKVTRS